MISAEPLAHCRTSVIVLRSPSSRSNLLTLIHAPGGFATKKCRYCNFGAIRIERRPLKYLLPTLNRMKKSVGRAQDLIDVENLEMAGDDVG